MPLWLSLSLVMPLTCGIATVLRLAHNRCCRMRRKKDAQMYRENWKTADLRTAVEDMARSRKRALRMADIVIPARVIRLMTEYSDDDMTVEDGCRRYLNTYLEDMPTAPGVPTTR